MGNNGIVDTFMRPKPGIAPYIKQFNARSIFLQDGLLLAYSSKDSLSVDISLSNFGDGDLPTGTHITWGILIDGRTIETKTVAVSNSVKQGLLGVVASIDCSLPDIGTTNSVPIGTTGPKTITVTARFASGGGSFLEQVPMNTYRLCSIFIFPDRFVK